MGDHSSSRRQHTCPAVWNEETITFTNSKKGRLQLEKMSLLQHVTLSPPLKTPRQTPFCSHLFTSILQEIWEYPAAVCIPLAAGTNWFRFTRINFGLEILMHLYPSQNLTYSFDSPTNRCFGCLRNCQSSAYRCTKSQVKMLQCLANAEKHQASRSFRVRSTLQSHLFECHGFWHLVTEWFKKGMLNIWYAQEDTSTQHRFLGFFLISSSPLLFIFPCITLLWWVDSQIPSSPNPLEEELGCEIQGAGRHYNPSSLF